MLTWMKQALELDFRIGETLWSSFVVTPGGRLKEVLGDLLPRGLDPSLQSRTGRGYIAQGVLFPKEK